MQVMLALVLISFVGWGVKNGNETQDTVATVDGARISALELRQQLMSLEQMEERRSGKQLTDADRARIRETAMQNLIQRTALLAEARRLGLEVSDVEIADALLDDPSLQKDGKFSADVYADSLRARGTTRGAYEEKIREELLLRKLAGLMALGASVSDPVVQQTFVEENTKVDLEMIRVSPAAFQTAIEPSAADLDAWIGTHADAIQARYEKDFARLYDLKEKVALSVIKLAVREDGLGLADLKPRLDKLKAELDGGADFATLARTWSEDPSAAKGGSLGEVGVAQLDASAQTVVQALAPGQLSEVVVGNKDVRLFKLDSRSPARVVPIDEVRRDIALTLYRDEEAPRRALAFAKDKLLAAWSTGGELPSEEMDALGIKASATGPVPVGGTPGRMGGPPPELLKAARDLAVGGVVPEVLEVGGSYYVARLTSRADADLADFEENKERYRESSLARARQSFFDGWVDAIVAAAKVERIGAPAAN
jgi:peptidyl-prolyl cis-trans isomerase D